MSGYMVFPLNGQYNHSYSYMVGLDYMVGLAKNQIHPGAEKNVEMHILLETAYPVLTSQLFYRKIENLTEPYKQCLHY